MFLLSFDETVFFMFEVFKLKLLFSIQINIQVFISASVQKHKKDAAFQEANLQETRRLLLQSTRRFELLLTQRHSQGANIHKAK